MAWNSLHDVMSGGNKAGCAAVYKTGKKKVVELSKNTNEIQRQVWLRRKGEDIKKKTGTRNGTQLKILSRLQKLKYSVKVYGASQVAQW